MRFLPMCGLALLCLAAPLPGDADSDIESEREGALYALGAAIGRQFQPLDLSPEEYESVAAGLRDAALSLEIQGSVFEYQDEIQRLQQERRQRAIDKDLARSQAFLDEIAAGEGVVRTETGLLYHALEEGSGPSPGPEDTVRVHYTGRLRSGEMFDSTSVRGVPALFPLTSVIECWTEGMQRMRVGGRARIVCPPAIGYGENGFPPTVPRNAPLDFTVELLSIE